METTPGTQFAGSWKKRARSSAEEEGGEEARHEESEGVEQGQNAKPPG